MFEFVCFGILGGNELEKGVVYIVRKEESDWWMIGETDRVARPSMKVLVNGEI